MENKLTPKSASLILTIAGIIFVLTGFVTIIYGNSTQNNHFVIGGVAGAFVGILEIIAGFYVYQKHKHE
jgi:uncharacterized membrane protein HdeD (DUF308 family)